MKTQFALVAAALFAALAMIPVVQASSLNTRSFEYVGEYLDTGARGLGIYDPDGDCLAPNPPCTTTTNPGDNYCVALFSEWDFFEVGTNYYDFARIFVQASATAAVPQIAAALVPLAGIPVLQDCAAVLFTIPTVGPILFTPGEACTGTLGVSAVGDDCQWIYNDGLNVGVGTAIFVDSLMGATDAATQNSVSVALDYCTLKVIGGVQRIGGEVVGDLLGLDTPGATVGASDIGCGNGGSYAPCGLTYTGSVLGDLVVDQPILLAGGALATICNSQRGAPLLGDFVTEVCVSADVTDTATGIINNGAGVGSPLEDTDWFVNAGTGIASYAQWLLNPASANVGGTSITNEPDLNGGSADTVVPASAQGTGSC
jgi:hypothetical protein